MKRFKSIGTIVTIAAMVLLPSCNFLNLSDPDSFDEGKFYQTEADMNGLLASSYQAFRNATNDLFFVTEMKSDNASTTSVSESGGLYYTFVSHQVTSMNTKVTDIYDYMYKVIHRANLVIEHIDDVTYAEASTRERLLGEAYFLRALAHFYLVRLWGPVTIMSHTNTNNAVAIQQTRDSEADVYNFITEDLLRVINGKMLPEMPTGEAFGHAGMRATEALLGEVYLQRASMTDDKALYREAITHLSKAANNADLTLSYTKLFMPENERCDEIIFSVQYIATADECSNFCSYFQPKGAKGLTSQVAGRGFNCGQVNLLNEFESTGKGFAANDRRVTTAITSYSDGSYYTKKYVSLTSDNGYGENDWYEIRLADVYLMLAEAYERVEGNESTNAIDCLNKVRTRTGNRLNDYQTSMQNAAYAAAYPTLRAAIFHERRVELCFENKRWFDLLRLYPKKADFAAYMQSVEEPNASGKYTGFLPYETLLPIPYDETFLNKTLEQNDGY